MRILLVNKYNYLRSGTERYLFNLERLLQTYGHTVAIFSMRHPQNRPAIYQDYFVPHVDFRDLTPLGRLSAALRVLWFPQAARQIAPVLDTFQPDIVHLSNIYHQLSPSILLPIYRRNIPTVQTLHDYKLICPNYLLYTQKSPCTRCRNGNYFQAVRHRCLHSSLAWSLLAAVEMTLHKTWRVYERHVASFITPSAFLKSTAQSFGIPAKQIVHIPNFLYPQEHTVPQGDGDYLAYIGRLSHEKGLLTLIRAMRQLPQAQLLIVGEGKMRPMLEHKAAEWKLTNVQFTGYLTDQALNNALARARFTVLPSEWYENFPFSILESLIAGKSVVASRIGGIPELIDDGENGLLFSPGDTNELAACLRHMWDNPEQTHRMGLNGRRKVLAQYGPENHYRQLYPLYERLTNESTRVRQKK
ncbi:MAG: glycosyltransferase family 4 protein [Chloroflexi bacterium]|nr:glycosyltransferase family 4 protein [Chloroflexota bacterium]